MNVRAGLAMTALVSLLAGCTPASTPAGNAGSTPPAGSTSASAPAASHDAVAKATTLAAMYDYDAALKALAGNTSPEAAAAVKQIEADKAKAVAYTDIKKVPHLFWHPLVVDPTKAFSAPGVGLDPSKPISQTDKDKVGNTQYMVTQAEFAKQLQSIYDKGYVLMHASRLYTESDGTMKPAEPIMLPPGKKPIVISEDDVNYYQRWADVGGFPAELVVGADGRVQNKYKDASGAWVTGSYDLPPMVDDFVREHPDFSYRGDKGTLALTGYEGALGYRSSVKKYGDTAETKQAASDAKKVADALKANGWKFASHTWNHISFQASTAKQIEADMERWKAEVEPITGKTDQLIYAFGSDLSTSITVKYSESDPKYSYLHDKAGFRYFFPIDNSAPYFAQVGADYYRQWRVNIDGITMQKVLDGKTTALPQFFDAAAVWDPKRPKPTPKLALGVK